MSRWFIRESRTHLRCSKCRFVFVPGGVAQTEAGKSIYEDSNPIFLRDGNEGYYFGESSDLNAGRKLRFVARFLAAGAPLLDIGACFGHFVRAASDRYAVEGIEVSPVAAKWGRENLGVRIETGSLYELPARYRGAFDGVTMWDVIEHVDDPVGAVRVARECLRPAGLCFMSTPDTGAVVARLMGSRWHYINPEQHIALFDRHNLRAVLEHEGFVVDGMESMGHDYRLGYVWDRLVQLYGGGLLGGTVRVLRAAGRPLRNVRVTINSGDVIALVARRAANGAS